MYYRGETFTSEQIQAAIESFLELGNQTDGESHGGYFSNYGWAARCLSWHLDQLKLPLGGDSNDYDTT